MSDHSIYDEMRDVHTRMIAKYNVGKSAAGDIKRARQMEEYLRAFKAAGNQRDDKQPAVIKGLEEQAMADLAAQVGKALGIGDYSLFRNEHLWYKKVSQSRWGADDVFEAELQQFLNIAVEQATQGKESGDAKLLGNMPGNIAKKYLEQIQKHGQKLANGDSTVITTPQFRSGKVDVASFSGNFTFTADMQPFWKNFIQVFSGARFTVKNYSSKSSTEVIHLGNTDITKSLIGALSDIRGVTSQAVHIYYHSLAYAEDPLISQHLLHLRFAYELAGGGLRDESGQKIDSADFFIYNDPASNNIYVRSTKEMIANAMNYMGNVRDPLRSNIIILKNSF